MSDDVDYSDHPISIGEVRADRENSSALITPRETLIRCLRLIDNGEWNPEVLVVAAAFAVAPDGRTPVRYRVSGNDALRHVGLLTNVLFHMQAPE